MKARQFVRLLRAAGVEIIEGRGRGSHTMAKHSGQQTIIPMHGARDLPPNFLRKICRQLGLDLDQII